MKKIIFASLIMVLGFSSCIKEEPLYREADIETFTIEGEGLITSSISGNRIQLVISKQANYKELIPVITLSPNATVEPVSGQKQDFTDDVVYTVTSEDGNYTKKYTVSVTAKLSFKYDFEEWLEGEDVEFPTLSDISWATGNSGAALTLPTLFPTRDTTDCVSGKKAVLLETIPGIKFGNLVVPVVSGSLFRGKFKLNPFSPPKSTLFGQPHQKDDGRPIRFTGHYKYLPGEKMINKEGEMPGRTDECSIYSILYKITKGSDESLDGTNILTSDKVVAKAQWTDTGKKEIFTRFEVPFTYSEELDFDANDYKLAVVFASSKNGDLYEGAIGSRLTIDDVEVECEAIKD